MSAQDVFWMICRRPTHARSETRPSTRYPTRAKAIAAAQAMADKTGHEFQVLAPVCLILPSSNTASLFEDQG